MITASHNPIEDNGAKIIDHHGGMLREECEKIVEKFSNEPDIQIALNYLVPTLESLPGLSKIEILKPSSVILACDTRPTSLGLFDLTAYLTKEMYFDFIYREGLSFLNTKIIRFPEITTPQTHFYGNRYYFSLTVQFILLIGLGRNSPLLRRK